jgi:hypothetical protein
VSVQAPRRVARPACAWLIRHCIAGQAELPWLADDDDALAAAAAKLFDALYAAPGEPL